MHIILRIIRLHHSSVFIMKDVGTDVADYEDMNGVQNKVRRGCSIGVDIPSDILDKEYQDLKELIDLWMKVTECKFQE